IPLLGVCTLPARLGSDRSNFDYKCWSRTVEPDHRCDRIRTDSAPHAWACLRRDYRGGMDRHAAWHVIGWNPDGSAGDFHYDDWTGDYFSYYHPEHGFYPSPKRDESKGVVMNTEMTIDEPANVMQNMYHCFP